MASAAKVTQEVLPPVEERTDIIAVINEKPQIALLDGAQYSAFYNRVKAETDQFVADTTTKKGRDEIRAMANKVIKSKTAIDKARLALTSQWRDQTKQVNESGKKIEAELEALAATVREPLTVWEAAEDAREKRCQAVIDGIKAAQIVTLDDTAADVRARGASVYAATFDPAEFGTLLDDAKGAREQAIGILKAALARLTKEEADKAELEALRAANAEREARELAERTEREAKERAANEAKEAEARRLANEKADQERIDKVKRDAEESAKRAAEKLAEAARLKVQRDHDAAIAAERKRADDAERAAQIERNRITAEQAAEAARIKASAAALAKREEDQAHRAVVMGDAKRAIMSCGADEETAKKVVMAIRAGEVPHVSLAF